MRIAAGAAALCLAMLGAACNLVPSTAEERAREFVELEIFQPPNASDRRRVLAAATVRIEGADTAVALDYLRARVRQGTGPEIRVATVHKPSAGEREVIVAVSPGPGRAAAEDRVRFRVQLARDAEQGWRVAGLRVE